MKVQHLRGALIAMALVFGFAGCASMQKDMGYQAYSSPEDWSTKTMSGPFLPLATEADVWSQTKTFNINGRQIGVQSKFKHQEGTTCYFDVKFVNNGTENFRQGASLSRHNLGQGYDRHTVDGKEGVYAHRVTTVNVAPGRAVWYEMEKRECPLKWGTSKDMTKCAECSPALVFVK